MIDTPGRLVPDLDASRDHIAGAAAAPVSLVEYGDYECPYCRAAHRGIQRVRERLGERMSYAFRHLPNGRLHPHAELAAEAAEAAGAQGKFWEMHDALFTATETLDEAALVEMAARLGLDTDRFASDLDAHRYAARVQEDLESALASGAHGTPTFYINGRRYDGAWDESALHEAIEVPLGLRIRRLSEDFAGLPASSGIAMLLAAGLALILANAPIGPAYFDLWAAPLTLGLGAHALSMPLGEWVNQGLMAVFFFVVGLEIKREITSGNLAEPRQAALPIAAAVGGMALPAAVYALVNAGGPAAHGWGVPMSTDTAFALGVLALLGPRVPLSLKVFVAALAIADDVGAILVIASFYAEHVSLSALGAAAAALLVGAGMNRARVYRPLPYAILGIVLWLCVLYSGIHATIAGVLLATIIPTRSPPAPQGLLHQSIAAFRNLEAPLPSRTLDETHYQAVARTLETVVERLLSPAQRLERDLQPWSSFLVLPLLALANAGIPLRVGASDLLSGATLGIALGLALAKPVGILLATAIVVRLGAAELPPELGWRQLVGAAWLCGIGFTMSIFIADAAFAAPALLDAAKLSIIAASIVAGLLGWALLRTSGFDKTSESRSWFERVASLKQGRAA